MSTMKREAVHATIRNQLMNDPQNGTLLLLNLMRLFADRKDDAEFIKELVDIASELTSVTLELSRQQAYPQQALFRQPVMVQPVTEYPNVSKISSQSQNFQEKLPKQPQVIAGDVMSALNELGQDTSPYQRNQNNEPVIQGYREWTPKPKKK